MEASAGVLLDVTLELLLPGFWVECSQYVLQFETCYCNLPKGPHPIMPF
jgi:hypothetical protein